MQGNTMGQVRYALNNSSYQVHARVYWDSATCGESPLLMKVESYYYQNYSGGRGGVDVFHVNEGKTF